MQETSLEAYDSIKDQLNEKQKRVLEAITHLGGQATNEQIADYLGVGVHTVCPRTGELIAKEKIIRTDKKVKTKSNREAYVFVVKQNQVGEQLTLI